MQFLLLVTELATAYGSQDFVHSSIVSSLYTSSQLGPAAIVTEAKTALKLAILLQNETIFQTALQHCVGLGVQRYIPTLPGPPSVTQLMKDEIAKSKE